MPRLPSLLQRSHINARYVLNLPRRTRHPRAFYALRPLSTSVLWQIRCGLPLRPVARSPSSPLDAATGYMAARPITSETSEQFLKAIERGWIRVFGVPHTLQVDAHPSWCSSAIKDWSSEQGVELQVSPGEAHQRLAQVERRQQVLRRAIDVFMTEAGLQDLEGLQQALDYVVPLLAHPVGSGISASASRLSPGSSTLAIWTPPVTFAASWSYRRLLQRPSWTPTAMNGSGVRCLGQAGCPPACSRRGSRKLEGQQ